MRSHSLVWLAAGLVLPLTVTASEKKEGAGAAGSETLAQVGPVAVSAARVDELAKDRLARLRAEEYKIKRQALDQEIERLLLEAEAAARRTTVADLLRVEGLPREQAAARRKELVAELRKKTSVKVFLEAPRIAIDDSGGPAKGPASAPVTIVTFSDFQCPYCQRLADTLASLEERYRGKVRLVFRDFPLPMHREAAKAAEAGACANEQGRFWEMHDKLFANQKTLQVADLKRFAGEVGLDQQAFDACLDGGRQAQSWQRGREQGEKYGVSGTPVTFINGRFVGGAQPLVSLAEIVDEELGRGPESAAARGR